MGRYVGVDLHKNMFVASFYDADIGKHQPVTFTLKDVSKFKRRLRKTDILGVECTTNTRYKEKFKYGLMREMEIVHTSIVSIPTPRLIFFIHRFAFSGDFTGNESAGKNLQLSKKRFGIFGSLVIWLNCQAANKNI